MIYLFFRGRKFIIQQAVDLIKVNNRIIDIRAEVQRNGKGELEVLGLPVRLGHSNSPITTHSSAYRFEDFFSEYMNSSQEEIDSLKNKIENLLINVYKGIESHYGPCGEMGIDLALDTEGNLWFFECNSQTTKASLVKAYDEETVRKSFLNPLEYAKFIANNNPRKKTEKQSFSTPVTKLAIRTGLTDYKIVDLS